MAATDDSTGAPIPTHRGWLRVLGVLTALLVGLVGVVRAHSERDVWALLIGAGVATVLLTLCAGLPRSTFLRASTHRRRPRWAVVLAVAGSAAAIAASAVSLFLFRRTPGGTSAAWLWYLLALASIVAAFWAFKGDVTEPSNRPSRREWLGLAVVVLLAATPRFHLLASFPYGVWFDEAQNALEAIKILEDPEYRPVFVAGVSQMPAFTFYYYSIFVALLGENVLAVRMAMTVVGILAVIAVWLLGRELFNPRVALIAAALLAICRWHIGFSRFGAATLFPTLFIPLCLFLFVRSQDRRSARAAVLCGLCMGLGIQAYYAIVATPVLVLLLFVHRVLSGRWRSLAAGGLLALTFTAAAIAYGPVFQFARTNPSLFAQRFSTVSILKVDSAGELIQLFRDDDRRDAFLRTLRSNTVKHLRMFHLVGDPNGRHNLPGAPMLDPVTGLFLAVGGVWCLLLVYRSEMGLLTAWFVAMIAAGILSLDFEAPQGARSSGLPAVIALIAALPLERAARTFAIKGDRMGRILGVGLAVALLAAAMVVNWRMYFHRQRWDAAAWASYSTPETKIAEVVKAAGDGADIYTPQVFLGGPTQTFLLGKPIQATPLQGASELPLPNRGRDAIVFLPGAEREAATRLQTFYPDATVEPFGAPRPDGSMGEPVLWIARVSARQMDEVGRWSVVYRGSEQEPVNRASASTVWNWAEAPVQPPFRAQIRGFLRIEQAGEYEFVLDGSETGELIIDGERVLDSARGRGARASLAEGNHRVALDLDVRGGGSTSLLWRQPGAHEATPLPSHALLSPHLPIGGLLGSYYLGLEWQGAPALRRVDGQVAFYFHLLPVPRPFSVHWTGAVYAPVSGPYSFTLESIDDSSATVAGKQVATSIDRRPSDPAPIELERGWHPIEVRYQNRSDYAQVYLYWKPPGGGRDLIPSSLLQPSGPTQQAITSAEAPPAAAGYLADDASPAAPIEVVAPEAAESPVALPVDARVLETIETGAPGALRLVVARKEQLYVLDPSQRFLVLVRDGKVSKRVALKVPAGGASDASDLSLDPAGNLLVLDASGRIDAYSPDGAHLRTIELARLGVYNPRGLAVSSRGEVAVSDTGGGRILMLDQHGTLLRQIGRRGTAGGELVDPIAVAFDDSGGLVVVDAGSSRLQSFSPAGEARDARAYPGIAPNVLSPQLAIDGDGELWLAGGESGRVERFSGRERHVLPAGAKAADLAFAPGATETVFVLLRPGGRVIELALKDR